MLTLVPPDDAAALAKLRAQVELLLDRKAKSPKSRDMLDATLLRSLLAGEDLTPLQQDGSPVIDESGNVIDRYAAIRFAMALLAEFRPEARVALVFARNALVAMLKPEEHLVTLEDMAAQTFATTMERNARRGKGSLKNLTEEENDKDKTTAATTLISLARQRGQLVHSSDNVAYSARGFVAKPVASAAYRLELAGAYFQLTDTGVGEAPLRQARITIEALAVAGAEHEVSLRTAGTENDFYLDLHHKIVHVTARNWDVLDEAAPDAPVLFRRPRKAKPLPVPERGGSLDLLRQLLNMPGAEYDETFLLIELWELAAMRPVGPYPILILGGEYGAAKSAATKILRDLVDPHAMAHRGEPREPRDLAVNGENNWVIAYDNLSSMPKWNSDSLCRMSTGGGFGTRTLFEDREEEVFEQMRPIIINSITDVATSPDFLSRGLPIVLPAIGASTRRTDSEVRAEYQAARPKILGALLDVLVFATERLPRMPARNLPRMADFARFAMAAAPALGYREEDVLALLFRISSDAQATVIEGKPLTVALQRWINRPASQALLGKPITATDLLAQLREVALAESMQDDWPKIPNVLSNMLIQMASGLRTFGIDVRRAPKGSKGTRGLIVTKIPLLPVDH